MGQVVGISRRICQTYPSASDLALVTEDTVPAGPHPTTDQFQGSPMASSRALPRQAHMCVMESNSSTKKLEVSPPGHAAAPLGQEKKKHRITIITLIITLPCTVPAHGTTNTVTTSYSTDEDYIMQTCDTYHKYASGKTFSLCFHGKLNHSGKITAIKLPGIQVSTVRTLMSHFKDCSLPMAELSSSRPHFLQVQPMISLTAPAQ